MEVVYPPILGNEARIMTLTEVEEIGVTHFGESTSRPLIWDGLSNCHERVKRHGFEGFYWIGGEFVTRNPEPKSLLLIVRTPHHITLSAAQKATVDWLHGDENRDSMCNIHHLHEVEPDDPDYEIFCQIENEIKEILSTHQDGTRRGYAIVRIEDEPEA